MQKDITNKAMQPDKAKTKAIVKETFHFSGSGEYKPVSIEAENREKAEEKWEGIKEKI